MYLCIPIHVLDNVTSEGMKLFLFIAIKYCDIRILNIHVCVNVTTAINELLC